MQKHWIYIFLISLLCNLSFSVIGQISENDVCGYWNTENNESVIKIFKGKDGKFWGEITSVKNGIETDKSDPNYGKPRIDKHTKKPLVGTMLFLGLIFDGEDCWEDGEVYDPESGKKYACSLSFSESKNILEVTGYMGTKLLGKTVKWTRGTGK